MELAVRLWLGINVQMWGIAVSSEMTRTTRIQWTDGVSLVDMVEQAQKAGPLHRKARTQARCRSSGCSWPRAQQYNKCRMTRRNKVRFIDR